MSAIGATRILAGPGAPAGWDGIAGMADLVSVNGGFDPGWERDMLLQAAERRSFWLSVRVTASEVLIGPLWVPGGPCSGCAQARALGTAGDPVFFEPPSVLAKLADETSAAGCSPLLRGVVETYARVLRANPLEPGELAAVSLTRGSRTHRIRKSMDCVLCGSAVWDRERERAQERPEPLQLKAVPSGLPVPTRGDSGLVLDRVSMREAFADHRFGPITQLFRDDRAPFAMTGVTLGGARFPGFGRGTVFADTEPVAILEAYERFGGYPHQANLVRDKAFWEISADALDPLRMGHYTDRQLAAPLARVRRYRDDEPMDWAWGHRLHDGSPVLVPADIAFYQYGYPAPGDRPDLVLQRARRADSGGRARSHNNYFLESSSGCALGASREEAVLHSLFELAERDAFLLAWHAAASLPELDLAEIRADPEARHLLDLIDSAGYDTHVLVTTADLAVPSVWVLVVNRSGGRPASFTAAGAGPEPIKAVRAGLWEVCQLVGQGMNWDPAEVEPMLSDPWRVDMLVDHHRLYGFPETLPRVSRALGGPVLSLADAFPDWPDRFVRHARGDIRQAVEFVAGLFASAGLTELIVVDQTTTEHAEAGLASVKTVVPGIVSMSFGHAQQRLAGLARLTDRLAASGMTVTEDDLPLDPHPFP
ncbi:TOMM precursor leader peptide-binding protein [Amycolatopsis sp. lyj-108]|uniref:TOMM precursor leader peptide-binding protein n=1 Tax=Amycolatopsis sp. lyj-108 TaxID=2789286 RepID=UPI00397C6BAB